MSDYTTKATPLQLHDLQFEPFLDAAAIRARVAALGRVISTDYAGKRPLLLGVLNGAFMFVADLMRALDIDCEVSFVKLRSYDGTQTTGNVETLLGLDTDIEGRHVLLVEDIVDTGNTLHYFLPDLKQHHPASVELVALLLKPAALQQPLDIRYLGFEIENRFVVGYGLDYNGLGRNLPALYQLKKA